MQHTHPSTDASGEETTRIVEHKGIRIPLVTDLLSPFIIEAIEAGRYEGPESRELPRIIQQGERVLELGAGIGFISSLVGKNELVSAVKVFEANPDLIPFIAKVHAMNDVVGVEVVNAVLDHAVDKPTRPFYVREHFWASSLSEEPFGFERKIDVAVRSFNAEVEAFRPTLIICDIEGGELSLFMNANLTGVQKVFVEIHQKVLGRRGVKTLFDAFSARNFHYDEHHSRGSVLLFSHVDRK